MNSFVRVSVRLDQLRMICTTELWDRLNANSFSRFFRPVIVCRSKPPLDWESTAIPYIRSSLSIDWTKLIQGRSPNYPIILMQTGATATLTSIRMIQLTHD